jgi:hypothetical protein
MISLRRTLDPKRQAILDRWPEASRTRRDRDTIPRPGEESSQCGDGILEERDMSLTKETLKTYSDEAIRRRGSLWVRLAEAEREAVAQSA